MGKIRTGFKVCSGRAFFKSAFDFGKTVEYEINIWTHQPEGCGPLSVFRRLCDVDDYIAHNISLIGSSETFLCEYEKSNESILYDNRGNTFGNVPYGTEFARRVKLIKKLHKL